MEDIGQALSARGVLYPCQDLNVLLISRHRSRLEPYYHIALPDSGTVEMLIDKLRFYEFADQHGLPIPETHILRNPEDAEIASRSIAYPCLLKPAFRSPEWNRRTPLKAFKAENPDKLLELYCEYSPLTETMIVQQWIEGTDEHLYSCNCYFDRQGRALVTFVARKLRQWPPRTGQSCLGEECRNDTVLEETIRLFQLVNYRGLGYLEMKRDRISEKQYIIEPNVGRPTGRSAIAEAAGVELLYTMYCDLTGRSLPKNIVQQYRGVKWIHLLRDLQSSFYYWRHGELTLAQWWRSLRGKKTYAVLSLSDPAPFLSALWHGVVMTLKGAFRKRFAERTNDRLESKSSRKERPCRST